MALLDVRALPHDMLVSGGYCGGEFGQAQNEGFSRGPSEGLAPLPARPRISPSLLSQSAFACSLQQQVGPHLKLSLGYLDIFWLGFF